MFNDFSSAEWHWVQLPDSTLGDFDGILSNTYVQLFASEVDDLTVCSHLAYFDTAPEPEFNLTIEQRHVFNEADIRNLSGVVTKQRPRKGPFMYALRFVNDGIGLNLYAAWTKTLRRVPESSYSQLQIKDLGQVKFIINNT